MPTQKDPLTESVRESIYAQSVSVETKGADAMLTTLSFQSISRPERHVWIDTHLAGDIAIDLEDWEESMQWDNAVAHFVAPDAHTVAAIAIAWLGGSSIEDCGKLGGTSTTMK